MGVILCEFESRPPHPNEKRKIERFSSFSLYSSLVILAQRKITVVLSFPYHRHKACIANDQQTVQCTFSAVDSDLRFQIRKQAFQSVIQGKVLPCWCATAECSRNPHGNDMQSSLKRHAIHTEMYDVEESIDI